MESPTGCEVRWTETGSHSTSTCLQIPFVRVVRTRDPVGAWAVAGVVAQGLRLGARVCTDVFLASGKPALIGSRARMHSQ